MKVGRRKKTEEVRGGCVSRQADESNQNPFRLLLIFRYEVRCTVERVPIGGCGSSRAMLASIVVVGKWSRVGGGQGMIVFAIARRNKTTLLKRSWLAV